MLAHFAGRWGSFFAAGCVAVTHESVTSNSHPQLRQRVGPVRSLRYDTHLPNETLFAPTDPTFLHVSWPNTGHDFALPERRS